MGVLVELGRIELACPKCHVHIELPLPLSEAKVIQP
jgi:hypothetical protein